MVQWKDYLTQVLLTKPAEVVQEACQVMEKHGFLLIKEKLKSELLRSGVSVTSEAMLKIAVYSRFHDICIYIYN